MFIEVYTKPNCPKCEQTKQLLDSNDTTYTEYVIDQDISRADTLAKYPGAKVVPIVVVDGNITSTGFLKTLLNE